MRLEDDAKDKLLALRRQLVHQEKRQEERKKNQEDRKNKEKEKELKLPIKPGDFVAVAEQIPGAFDLAVGSRARVEAKYPNGMIRISVEQPEKPPRELLAQERFFQKVLVD